MAENTSIEWCDHTFNPWIGCTKVAAFANGGHPAFKRHRGYKVPLIRDQQSIRDVATMLDELAAGFPDPIDGEIATRLAGVIRKEVAKFPDAG